VSASIAHREPQGWWKKFLSVVRKLTSEPPKHFRPGAMEDWKRCAEGTSVHRTGVFGVAVVLPRAHRPNRAIGCTRAAGMRINTA
jgi:hypothetical protein